MRIHGYHDVSVKEKLNRAACTNCFAQICHDVRSLAVCGYRDLVACGIEIAACVAEGAACVDRALLLLGTARNNAVAAVYIDSALGFETVRTALYIKSALIYSNIIVCDNT